ncbi:hypothetical protein [Alkalicoccus halolimnae]|uniref:Uncharacterized protein n=1 Tax=Alkalicoccus halolimnae TaxID=1667239 RepID=A0A5C7F974_9BACI|nr:hypothetical protein [Alkalicoccus halolimnae]TXF85928.1 hypothetical protein FTX54_07580 [Alkalicoccus halolimnae]
MTGLVNHLQKLGLELKAGWEIRESLDEPYWIELHNRNGLVRTHLLMSSALEDLAMLEAIDKTDIPEEKAL